MFTGIVTDLGVVRRIVRGEGREARFEIASGYDTATIAIGASIAHNGVCLTIVEVGPDWHTVEASAETLSKTTLGGWKEGSRSTWNGRSRWATNWAAISFRATWTAWPR
ncbi:hypothetical protein amb2342 [Paramagnetospirillum magneticum AMB-1]|uniref:Riboflavin synthase n=1 Tax=Paramagnetospirillum magneticum (strain ATCC 700264 / AMB-1) TaxID=342108 RepID=Q2W4S9_PARM1|nr:hypothetical protein amb2342 [Paramagnetospirillum magneticum AMB-1]